MNEENLIRILKKEKKVIKLIRKKVYEIIYYTNTHVKNKNKIEDFISLHIFKLIYKINSQLANKKINLLVEYKEEKKIDNQLSIMGEKRFYYSLYFTFYIYHIINSSYSPIKYKNLNTEIKCEIILSHGKTRDELKKIIKNDDLKPIVIDFVADSIIAFIVAKYTTECNSLFYLKYEDIEFILKEDDFYTFKKGDFIADLVTKRNLKNVEIEEVLDFYSTDGAMRFIINKKRD